MDQKEFREILKKYLSGRASEHEIQIVEKWYKEMEQQPAQLGGTDEEKLEEQYLTTIMGHVAKDAPQTVKAKANIRLPRYFVAVAASVILLIVSLFVITKNIPGDNNAVVDRESGEISWKYIANNSDTAERYTLPDGSSVTLEPNSNLKFSPIFNQSMREVQLEGEGFFEVIPSKDKQFLVYANDITTRVLGTSFTVRSFREDKHVTVAVRTGKVSVFAKSSTSKPTQEIILTPNQEVTYDRRVQVAARRIVEKPQPIVSPKEIERLRFEEAPLQEILEAIEKVYGVNIEYDADKFSSCTLTTSVSGGGLYNRMDIITSAIGAKYEVKEDRIVITGEGCNYRKR